MYHNVPFTPGHDGRSNSIHDHAEMDNARLYGRSLQTPFRELTDGGEGDAIGGKTPSVSLPLPHYYCFITTTSLPSLITTSVYHVLSLT